MGYIHIKLFIDLELFKNLTKCCVFYLANLALEHISHTHYHLKPSLPASMAELFTIH